jgi:hypothetical protein
MELIAIGDVKLLAGFDQAGVWTDRSQVRVIDAVDRIRISIAAKFIGDCAEAVAGFNGIAGSAGFQIGA